MGTCYKCGRQLPGNEVECEDGCRPSRLPTFAEAAKTKTHPDAGDGMGRFTLTIELDPARRYTPEQVSAFRGFCAHLFEQTKGINQALKISSNIK